MRWKAYQPKEKLEQVYDHILEIKIDNESDKEDSGVFGRGSGEPRSL